MKGESPIKMTAAAGDEVVDEPFVQLAKLWAKAFHLRLRPARHQCFADLLMRRPIDEGDDSFQVSASGMVAPCGAHSVHPLRILQLCYRGAQYLVDLRMAGQHPHVRSEEPTSELQSLMRISYAVFCLKKKKNNKN